MLKYATQRQRRLRVGLLKPRGRLRRIAPGLHQIVDAFAESGIGQITLELLPRDRLQDDPRVVRELPQHRIQLPPHLVGGVVPRRTHIQGKLGQGIKPLDVRG